MITQVEPLSAVVEEQVPVTPPQEEAPVQQETEGKEDEEPMEEESNPVIQEQSDTVSQVSYPERVSPAENDPNLEISQL